MGNDEHMEEWPQITQLIPYIGVPGAMALALVYALTRGWLVPGWLYRHEQSRADKWERRALENLRLAHEAVTVADKSLTSRQIHPQESKQ